MYDPPEALGLTERSTQEERRRAAFDFTHQLGHMTIATIAEDGATPTARAIEVHYLTTKPDLYIGVSRGKPLYAELLRHPFLTGVATRLTTGRLSISVRITAHATPTDDPKLRKRYWELNPGTASLYRKDPENFRLFHLDRGDGEVFHLALAHAVARVRFGWGGDQPRPWRYTIGEGCTGCARCVDACMTNVIRIKGGLAEIDHRGCLECGLCQEACPVGAVKKSS
jgi:ferredoxin